MLTNITLFLTPIMDLLNASFSVVSLLSLHYFGAKFFIGERYLGLNMPRDHEPKNVNAEGKVLKKVSSVFKSDNPLNHQTDDLTDVTDVVVQEANVDNPLNHQTDESTVVVQEVNVQLGADNGSNGPTVTVEAPQDAPATVKATEAFDYPDDLFQKVKREMSCRSYIPSNTTHHTPHTTHHAPHTTLPAVIQVEWQNVVSVRHSGCYEAILVWCTVFYLAVPWGSVATIVTQGKAPVCKTKTNYTSGFVKHFRAQLLSV